jgi:hypothetical protein
VRKDEDSRCVSIFFAALSFAMGHTCIDNTGVKNVKDPWVFILSLGRQRERREMLRIFAGFTDNYSVHV